MSLVDEEGGRSSPWLDSMALAALMAVSSPRGRANEGWIVWVVAVPLPAQQSVPGEAVFLGSNA